MDRDFYVEYDKDAQYCEVCKSCMIKDDDFGGQSLYCEKHNKLVCMGNTCPEWD